MVQGTLRERVDSEPFDQSLSLRFQERQSVAFLFVTLRGSTHVFMTMGFEHLKRVLGAQLMANSFSQGHKSGELKCRARMGDVQGLSEDETRTTKSRLLVLADRSVFVRAVRVEKHLVVHGHFAKLDVRQSAACGRREKHIVKPGASGHPLIRTKTRTAQVILNSGSTTQLPWAF